MANSGPVYWQGYPASEVIALEKDSPIRVESENLLFDFSGENYNFYTPAAKVTAVYEMFNPLSRSLAVPMAFPFVGNLSSLLTNEIAIAADGRELPYEIYFGDAVDSGNSFGKNKDARFDFASILDGIRAETYQAVFQR